MVTPARTGLGTGDSGTPPGSFGGRAAVYRQGAEMRPHTLPPATSRRVFLSGQAASLLGEGLAVLTIPLLVLQVTNNPVAAALAAATRSIGYLVAGLPAGTIVDRLRPWTVLITMDIIRALAFGALYLLTLTTTVTPWVIITLAVVAGAAAVFFDTALTVVVQDLFTGPHLIRANSFLELAFQGSLILGPAFAGVLALAAGVEWGLLVTSLTYLTSLATIFALRTPMTATPTSDRKPWRHLGSEFLAGLAYLRRARLILTMTILQAVINLCLAVETLIIFFAMRTLMATESATSAMVAVGGVGGVIGAVTAPLVTARLGQIRTIGVSVALIGLTLTVMGVAPSIWWLTAANLILVWTIVLPSIVIRTMRQQLVPRALLGRITSITRVLFLAVTPIGAVLAGTLTGLADNNPRPAFIGAGILIMITVALAWHLELRRPPTPPETGNPSTSRPEPPQTSPRKGTPPDSPPSPGHPPTTAG